MRAVFADVYAFDDGTVSLDIEWQVATCRGYEYAHGHGLHGFAVACRAVTA